MDTTDVLNQSDDADLQSDDESVHSNDEDQDAELIKQ